MKYKLLFSFLLFSQVLLAQSVAPDTFALQLKEARQPQLIDVRTPGEFADGHLPDAVNIDAQSASFDQSLAKLDKDKPVFVYCLSGGRSKMAAEKLHKMGFNDVHEMKGGYLKWSARMMPVAGVKKSTAKPEWNAARFDSLIRSQKLVMVDVYASWCAPCKKMAPIIDQVSQQIAGKATIVKLNADTEKPLMKAYQIEELPTILIFRNGKLTDRKLGFQDEAALKALLN
ncbi:thioredoxin [Dyadobacter luticola]|uniref:Thioredoxin n=1 Tax=Dyadobacter luticola TaxID=1979387 RepID=A0A5R9KPQ6_9BACT|nr:thioredoxin [Dyadobacter luticola]TLU98213.1 thioredoxin [Dyadobacter luticola]